MDAAAAHWPQELRRTTTTSSSSSSSSNLSRISPSKDQNIPQTVRVILHCPRCNSTNTKFCYYNNYSLTQPRYFCKTCRRYWTEGGSLRNVPVGGGSRKNKRSSSSANSTADHHLKKKSPDSTSTATAGVSQMKEMNMNMMNTSLFYDSSSVAYSFAPLQEPTAVFGMPGLFSMDGSSVEEGGGGRLMFPLMGDLGHDQIAPPFEQNNSIRGGRGGQGRNDGMNNSSGLWSTTGSGTAW